jgi:hypothetical protein
MISAAPTTPQLFPDWESSGQLPVEQLAEAVSPDPIFRSGTPRHQCPPKGVAS